MMLLSGGVKVEHVRQKKTRNFVTKDTGLGVNVYELKETNTRPLSPKEDEIVTLEHKTNQEIPVEVNFSSLCSSLWSIYFIYEG